jgi:3'-phosphoadenosine 5'-phosphosulfate sulfotransferase (PAPS reductase)/FAD synthetase
MTLRYAKSQDLILFANTGKEHEKTLEFVERVSQELVKTGRQAVVWLEYIRKNDKRKSQSFKVVDFATASRKSEPFEAFLENKRYLPNIATRACTIDLKIKTIERYLKAQKLDLADLDMFIGIRYDEPRRYHKSKGLSQSGWENVMPLFQDKVTKPEILNFWASQAFDLEVPEGLGNCDLCFLKGANKRLSILEHYPEVGNWWAEQEAIVSKNVGKKATFDKNHSVADLIYRAKTQNYFEYDNGDIECFCNND